MKLFLFHIGHPIVKIILAYHKLFTLRVGPKPLQKASRRSPNLIEKTGEDISDFKCQKKKWPIFLKIILCLDNVSIHIYFHQNRFLIECFFRTLVTKEHLQHWFHLRPTSRRWRIYHNNMCQKNFNKKNYR